MFRCEIRFMSRELVPWSCRQSNSFCTPHPHRWVLPVGLYVGIPYDFCNRRICFVEDRFNYLAMENLQSHYGRFDS